MQTRTIYRFGLVTGLAGLLLATALGFVYNHARSEAAEEGAAAASAEVMEAEPTRITAEPVREGPRVDVAFVIDVTGSMQDEMEVIKGRIWEIASQVAAGSPTPDVRFGLVLYRDKTDDFVVHHIDLTRDIGAIHERLAEVDATGGGDHREHLLAALDRGLELGWSASPAVSKKMYLVGDAPAQTGYEDGRELEELLAEANAKNIRIDSIGCSGIDRAGGERQFARISAATAGTYQSLVYHAVVEDEQGGKKSVVYRDGEVYVADEVLSAEAWQVRADELIERGRVEPADGADAVRARRNHDRTNNFHGVVRTDMQELLEARGVEY